MEPLAILALQFVNAEARSALPDAPIVEYRPSLFSRLVGRVASTRHRLAGEHRRETVPAVLPRRGDVRRAA